MPVSFASFGYRNLKVLKPKCKESEKEKLMLAVLFESPEMRIQSSALT